MNIFVLDRDPEVAATMLCNKHVVKMIVESGQLLCAAHWLSDDNAQAPYKLTHAKHPCATWTRSTPANYNWLLVHMRAMLTEYTKRYKKTHKSEEVWQWLKDNRPKSYLLDTVDLTDHVICMPDEIREHTSNPVKAYRVYYLVHKHTFARWYPHAVAPDWWTKSANAVGHELNQPW
jgi:hypothetical protein